MKGDKVQEELLEIVNGIMDRKGRPRVKNYSHSISLRNDLGLDSLDLAEFTVRVEDRFGVDIFEDGLVDLLGDVWHKLCQRR